MKKIIAEVSARHIHLSEKDKNILFGIDYRFKVEKKLSQLDHFAAKEKVVLQNKNQTLTARVLLPLRAETQVELSMTDCKFLDLEPTLRLSGDTKNSSSITLVGSKGKTKLKTGVIVAKRHLHLSEVDAKNWQLKNKQKVSVQVKGERELIFKSVIVRVCKGATRLHLDTDEANAAGIKNGDVVYLI